MRTSSNCEDALSRLGSLKFGGARLSSLCAPQVLEFYDSENKVIFALKRFIKVCWSRNEDHERLWKVLSGKKNVNLVSFATSRQSHKELLDAYVQKIGLEDNHLMFQFRGKSKLSCNLFVFIKALRFCLQKRVFKSASVSSISIFLAVLEFFGNREQIKYYFGDSKPVLNYFCLNAAWGPENLYTHFFNSTGVETFSFQHAAYCDFEHILPIELNNYSNIPSKYFLSWGEYTTEQVSKYFPERLIVLYVGNPIVERFLESKILSFLSFNTKTILVALPRRFYFAEIESLVATIDAASASSMYKYIIRLHPSVTRDEFLKISVSCRNFAFEFDDEPSLHQSVIANNPCAIISFNSSVVFELLTLGDIIHLYNAKRNDFVIDKVQTFNSGEELFTNLKRQNQVTIDTKHFFDDRDLPMLRSLVAS